MSKSDDCNFALHCKLNFTTQNLMKMEMMHFKIKTPTRAEIKKTIISACEKFSKFRYCSMNFPTCSLSLSISKTIKGPIKAILSKSIAPDIIKRAIKSLTIQMQHLN